MSASTRTDTPPRPRLFPENDHEDSVYEAWRAQVAQSPCGPSFRQWYETEHGQAAS